MGGPPQPPPPPPPPPRSPRGPSPCTADSARARHPLRGAEPAPERRRAGVTAEMGAPPPPPPPPRRPGRDENMPHTRLPLRGCERPAGAYAKSAAAETSAAPRAASALFLPPSTERRGEIPTTPTPPRPPLRRGALRQEACITSPGGGYLCQKRDRSPPEEETDEHYQPPPARPRLLFSPDAASSSTAPATFRPCRRFLPSNSRTRPPPPPTTPSASSYEETANLDWNGPGLHRFNSRTGPTTPSASTTPSTSSQGDANLDWNGPGLHRFYGIKHLLLSVGDLNRFFSRREELCILQNARHFLQTGLLNDACDDPCRRDYDFLVVSRRTLLEMADRTGVVEGRFWPGYKEDYYELAEERKISTLKVDENTFLWRYEVSGSRLLRRRVCLNSDEGPFEDNSRVFYILQYHKLPRTRKDKKAIALAERARKGHY